jgi:formylglycine-generating enzyme required for sulfatase activity
LLDSLKQVAAMEEHEARDWMKHRQEKRSRHYPAYWFHPRYNNPLQPVVGVTWFEALAYTRWLQYQLQVVGCTLKVWKDGELVDVSMQPGTFNVYLPSEVEWEAAARGQRGRRYPWGGRWRADWANTWEGHVWRPTPVGIYPQGGTPEGLEDLAGNVWEWTRSLAVDYPYESEVEREELAAEGYRIVRGGSWDRTSKYARCACRGRDVPDFFVPLTGFRIMLSL